MTDRELDKLIAKKVFGCMPYPLAPNDEIVWFPNDNLKDSYSPRRVPYYSDDISAAFEIVEQIRKISHQDVFSLVGPSDESDQWFCTFEKKWHGHNEMLESIYAWEGGETAPLAICHAALQVVGEK